MQAPRRNSPPPDIRPAGGSLIWLSVSLVVLATLPGMMSGNFLPKTFWAAITIGAGLAWLPNRPQDEFKLTPLGAAWLVYLAWALLSLVWAPAARAGFERWLTLVLLTLAYLLARRTRFWESSPFWTTFSILVGAVAAVGILQYFFPAFPLIQDLPGTAVPRSTLGSRNYAGMYLMVTFPFLFWCYLRRKWPAAALPFIALSLNLTFLLLGRTRGAWVGLLGGAIFALAAGGWRLVPRYREKLLVLILIFSASLLLAYSVGLPVGAERSFEGKFSFGQTIRSVLDPRQRLDFWRPVLGLTDPVLGAGFGNFPVAATPYSTDGRVKTLNWEVHNDYLQAYVDLGLPGVGLFVLVFLLLLSLAWQGRKSGLLLAAGASAAGLAFMQFTTFTAEKVSTQVWFAGVAALLNCLSSPRPLCRLRVPVFLSRSLNYLAVIWLLLFAAAVGSAIRGDRGLRKAHREINRVLSYREILENPDNYSPELIRRIRRDGPREYRRVRQELDRLAGRVFPTILFDANMKHISAHQFAGLALRLENHSAAEKFARQALSLHPADRTSLIYLAEIAFRRQEFGRARSLLEEGVRLFGYNPHSPYFGRRLIQIYQHEGRAPEAARIREEMDRNLVTAPVGPIPENRAAGIPPDEIIFRWEGSPAAKYFDFYLWESGEEEPEYPTRLGLRESRIGPLRGFSPGTTYFWRVRAFGRYGEAGGRIWFFRTADQLE